MTRTDQAGRRGDGFASAGHSRHDEIGPSVSPQRRPRPTLHEDFDDGPQVADLPSFLVSELIILFYFISFYFILFYFILFYFILFYFILFYFILFYFILFYFISELIRWSRSHKYNT